MPRASTPTSRAGRISDPAAPQPGGARSRIALNLNGPVPREGRARRGGAVVADRERPETGGKMTITRRYRAFALFMLALIALSARGAGLRAAAEPDAQICILGKLERGGFPGMEFNMARAVPCSSSAALNQGVEAVAEDGVNAYRELMWLYEDADASMYTAYIGDPLAYDLDLVGAYASPGAVSLRYVKTMKVFSDADFDEEGRVDMDDWNSVDAGYPYKRSDGCWSYSSFTATVDRATGARLRPADLPDAGAPEAKAALQRLIAQACQDCPDIPDYAEYPASQMADLILSGGDDQAFDWFFERDGLHFYLNLYDYGDNEFGWAPIEAVIPYEQLKGVIQDRFIPGAAAGAEAQDPPGFVWIDAGDERFRDSGYQVIGEPSPEGNSILAFDGSAAQVTVRAAKASRGVPELDPILFYADALSKSIIYLSKVDEDSCRITAMPGDGLVTKITLSESEKSIAPGQSFMLFIDEILPESAANRRVVWEVSDSGCVSFDRNIVTGLQPGTARITATSEDGNASAHCDVHVIPVSVSMEEIGNVQVKRAYSVRANVVSLKDAPSAASLKWTLDGGLGGHSWGEAQISPAAEGSWDITRQLTVSEPGDYTLTLSFGGASASRTFTVEAAERVVLEDPTAILPGREIPVDADVYTARDGLSADDLVWRVDAPEDTYAWRSETSILSAGAGHYVVSRRLFTSEAGEYGISLRCGEAEDRKALVVEPELELEIGPLLADGTLAEGENRTFIHSCCDIRLKAGLARGDADFLGRFLDGVRTKFSKAAFIVLRDETTVDADGRSGARVLRVFPAENRGSDYMRCEFEAATQGGQRLTESLRARRHYDPVLTYRSDGSVGVGAAGSNSVQASHRFHFEDAFFYQGATRYNNRLAVMTLGLEICAYSSPRADALFEQTLPPEKRAENIMAAYRKLDFRDVVSYRYDVPLTDNSDEAAFTIAKKYIASERTNDTLIAVVVRGGGYGAEWASNFHVGADGNSAAFQSAADIARQHLERYLAEQDAKGLLIGDVKLWITGFSRGGATANLLAHDLNRSDRIAGVYVAGDDRYVYTYATPAGFRGVDTSDANIFNIVSENDLVPKVPFGVWGFTRYGKDLLLPQNTPGVVADAFWLFTKMDLSIRNGRSFQEAVIRVLTTLYSSPAAYQEKAQAYVVQAIEDQCKTPGGSFAVGLAIGLVEAMLHDNNYRAIESMLQTILGASPSGNLLTDKLKEVSIVGASAAEGFIGLLLSELTQNALFRSDDEDAVGFMTGIMAVHNPEHYLAWLETGGILPVNSDSAYSRFDAIRLDTVQQAAEKWMASRGGGGGGAGGR